MSEDQSHPCQGCSNIPEEYIQLACQHEFCLACLAYSYLNFLNEDENSSAKDVVLLPCDICKSETELDR
jgi:hypothetical protein